MNRRSYPREELGTPFADYFVDSDAAARAESTKPSETERSPITYRSRQRRLNLSAHEISSDQTLC